MPKSTHWEILHFKLPEINPASSKCALQFPNSHGLVYYNATLKTSECFRKKSLSAIESYFQVDTGIGLRSETSVSAGSSAMIFWLCFQLLQPLIPWPLAVNNRCDNYHTALKEKSAPSQCSVDRITSLRLVVFSKQNQIWCLHRQHGKFLTKKKCYPWLLLALCAQAGHPNFFTQPHSLSSNNSLLQLVENAVINCNFFYISRRATCFRFTSF